MSLQSLRSHHQLTQRQLSAALGVSRSRLAQWEQQPSCTVRQTVMISNAVAPLVWAQCRTSADAVLRLLMALDGNYWAARMLLLLGRIAAQRQPLYQQWVGLGKPASLEQCEIAMGLYPSRRRASLGRCDRRTLTQLENLGHLWAPALPQNPAAAVIEMAGYHRELALLCLVALELQDATAREVALPHNRQL